MLDPEETPRQAAIRELHEETGILAGSETLDAAAVVEFTLHSPDRREYAAVFRTELDEVPALRPNEEATSFLWWDPSTGPTSTMGLLDAEIARRCCERPAHGES
jgi:8-oxo-dGTP pyrophosphatase MutT (NUDIX family)